MSSTDWNTRSSFIDNIETRRRFVSDKEIIFYDTINKKLANYWNINVCDYASAGVSEADFNKYKNIVTKVLDYQEAKFVYTNYTETTSLTRWSALNLKYKLSDIQFMPTKITKQDDRKDVQQCILRFVFENVPFKKKPLLAKLRDKYPQLNAGSINRQLNNLLKLRVLEIDTKYKTKPFVIQGQYFKNYFIK